MVRPVSTMLRTHLMTMAAARASRPAGTAHRHQRSDAYVPNAEDPLRMSLNGSLWKAQLAPAQKGISIHIEPGAP